MLSLQNDAYFLGTFLLTEDTFMPEMYLRQHRFAYSACGLFSRNRTRTRKFREKRESRYSYRNEIDKVSVSSRRWHKEISKIYQEVQFLTKSCVTKHLKLLLIYSMADISMELHQQFTIL